LQETPEQQQAPGAAPRTTQTFGGLVRVPLNQTVTLLSTNGLVFKGHCTPSATEGFTVAEISVAVDEVGCWYSSLGLIGGDVTSISPTDGDVTVLSYDGGCDTGSPFYAGGVSFSIMKPTSNLSANGVMSCGVGLISSDPTIAVFSGLVVL
jgi:hypothetical protein